MWKMLGLIIVLAISAVLIVAATKPDTFRVERAADISAPPEKVFALINDFGRWTEWSPWEKKDPAMKRTLSGAASGAGARYAWDGNDDVGQGQMSIAESIPPAKVAIKLDFTKPFEAHNDVEFSLVASGDRTRVTWAMQAPTPYFAKIIRVFLDMDRMVGQDFEAGLANLKALAEQQAGGNRSDRFLGSEETVYALAEMTRDLYEADPP
jgi:uncharacterized protein YndB with AHSA1/START domain